MITSSRRNAAGAGKWCSGRTVASLRQAPRNGAMTSSARHRAAAVGSLCDPPRALRTPRGRGDGGSRTVATDVGRGGATGREGPASVCHGCERAAGAGAGAAATGGRHPGRHISPRQHTAGPLQPLTVTPCRYQSLSDLRARPAAVSVPPLEPAPLPGTCCRTKAANPPVRGMTSPPSRRPETHSHKHGAPPPTQPIPVRRPETDRQLSWANRTTRYDTGRRRRSVVISGRQTTNSLS